MGTLWRSSDSYVGKEGGGGGWWGHLFGTKSGKPGPWLGNSRAKRESPQTKIGSFETSFVNARARSGRQRNKRGMVPSNVRDPLGKIRELPNLVQVEDVK